MECINGNYKYINKTDLLILWITKWKSLSIKQ